jgi:methyl-accepting chemotaxis protein
MLKNMKLSTKIAFGFGILVLIAAVMGITGWIGLSKVSDKIYLANEGNNCLEDLNKCASLRRDFTIKGFGKDSDGKNAADYWQDAYAELNDKLKELGKSSELKESDLDMLGSSLDSLENYKIVFEKQVDAKNIENEAFDEWKQVGWEITNNVNEVLKRVILPAKERALEGQNFNEYKEWTKLENHVDQKIIEPFLLLRVTAVYLMVTKSDSQWEGYKTQLEKVKSNIGEWKSYVSGNSELEGFADKILGYISTYEKAGVNYYNSILTERETDKEMAKIATEIVNNITELKDSLQAERQSITSVVNSLIIVLTICGIIIGTLLAFVITLSITKPVKRVIDSLTRGSEQITSASDQVASSGQSMAEGANEQASSLEEISSSLEEITSMTKQNADNAKQANNLANESSNEANNGKNAMERMSNAINKIKTSSDETAKIIKTIDEIAFQTNLLALNAAVEAARAGEAGKGFAVVAEEVRNLAQRSADAAKNTAELIEDSQLNSEEGVKVSGEVGEILLKITETVEKVANLIAEVSAASDEQSQGIEQVNTAVAQLDQVTQGNAANAEESASASEELSAQAKELNEMVDDLVAIVDGSKGNVASRVRKTEVNQPVGKIDNRIHKHVFSLHDIKAKKTHSLSRIERPVTKEKVVKPEEIIPLDDDDLGDF